MYMRAAAAVEKGRERRKVSAGKPHTLSHLDITIKQRRIFPSSPPWIHKDMYVSSCLRDAHTLYTAASALAWACSFLFPFFQYNIGCWNSELQNRKQWTGIYWQKQSYGGRWEIHKEQCLLFYSRADRQRQIFLPEIVPRYVKTKESRAKAKFNTFPIGLLSSSNFMTSNIIAKIFSQKANFLFFKQLTKI